MPPSPNRPGSKGLGRTPERSLPPKNEEPWRGQGSMGRADRGVRGWGHRPVPEPQLRNGETVPGEFEKSPRSAQMRSPGLAEKQTNYFFGLPDTPLPRLRFERPNEAQKGPSSKYTGRKTGRPHAQIALRIARIHQGVICFPRRKGYSVSHWPTGRHPHPPTPLLPGQA
jgi:hypothetical protein